MDPGGWESLPRQALEDQGVLGREELAEPHMVKRQVPEEREYPIGVDLRSARRADLLDVPASSGLVLCKKAPVM